MSDAGKEQREWRFYLDDMIAFAKKVQTYTDGLTQAEFTANGLTYDATLRNLELIGEAATHVPNEMSTANPDILWRLGCKGIDRKAHIEPFLRSCLGGL